MRLRLVKKESHGGPYREIDIFCISDGKLIIGECKMNNKLELNEIMKYKNIYNETNSKKIIFSTFNNEGWSEGTLNKLNEILGDDVNYELYNKKNLC